MCWNRSQHHLPLSYGPGQRGQERGRDSDRDPVRLRSPRQAGAG